MLRLVPVRVGRPVLPLVIAGLLVTLLAPAAQAQAGTACAGGDRLWVARLHGPASTDDVARAMGVSPDGEKVFVTGSSTGVNAGSDYVTAAYDAATGARLWLTRFSSPGSSTNQANALGVSPDGSTVFVTGYSGTYPDYDYATIAYDAATGTQRWLARYAGPGDGQDLANALAVSPTGGTVFVTGESEGSDFDYATVAYNAATGDQLWVARYVGPGVGFWDVPYAVGASPDGSEVFVTGASTEGGGSTYFDYATVAYDAATGDQRWVKRVSLGADDVAYALQVSPDGSTVFVTGYSDAGSDYVTVAYRAATGTRMWLATYNGPNGDDVARAVGVSPDGSTVFVTGQSGEYGAADYATVAYDAGTGHQLWTAGYAGPAKDEDVALALAVSPDGSAVYITGYSDEIFGLGSNKDYVTIAHDAATGGTLWKARFNDRMDGDDVPHAVAVSPGGSAVFLTGGSGVPGNADFVTIALAP